MKIAMISTPCVSVPPRDYGGTELVVHELTEGLIRKGHDVTLFATGDSRTSAQLRYLYRDAQWPPNIMTDLNHVSWCLEQVRDDDFDVVHVHSAAALAFARFLNDVPVVYTLHHVRDEDLSAFYRFYQSPYYVAISASQARQEVPLERLEVIHHGLNPLLYECSSEPSDYVAFIGRFAEIKGPHIAIDVAARAGVPIRVAGSVHAVDGEYGAREVEPRLRLPHVIHLGTIGLDRKVPILRDARALLMPICWEEPFGLVMVEAMLSGCPVIAFPRGSVPEVIEDGITGFVVRDENEMVDTLRPGGPLASFDRLRCRERAIERFSSARMVGDYERLYESVSGTFRAPSDRPRLRAAV